MEIRAYHLYEAIDRIFYFLPRDAMRKRGLCFGPVSAGNDHYLHLQTQFGDDRCTQFRVMVVTDPQTNTSTHKQTGLITIHCAAILSAKKCKPDNIEAHQLSASFYRPEKIFLTSMQLRAISL